MTHHISTFSSSTKHHQLSTSIASIQTIYLLLFQLVTKVQVYTNMPWFSSKKPKTATEWHDHVLRKLNIQQVAKLFLSDLNFDDKVKILLSMPDAPTTRKRDVAWLEFKLEDAGHTQLAQVVRFVFFGEAKSNDDLGEFMKWAYEVVRGDIKARWITQREIYLQEEVHCLDKLLSLSTNDEEASSRLKEYEEELQSLKGQILDHSRQLWQLETGGPTDVQKSFKTCRSDPNWYLGAWLRQDYARSGGCRGRGCRCCEKARGQTHHRRNYGHCTSACGCCVRTHGLPPDDVESELPDSPKGDSMRAGYYARIIPAYIWRLSFMYEF